jgi:hypothetical protein
MADETQNANLTPVTIASTPVTPPVAATIQQPVGVAFHKAVGEATRYTVFAIFVL